LRIWTNTVAFHTLSGDKFTVTYSPRYTIQRKQRKIYAAALGIEILCIAAAQIGENTSFFLFGYSTHIGIIMGYLLGYSLFSFTTFATILGRYNYVSNNRTVCGCRSVLEQGANVQIFHVRYIHINSFSDYLIKLHLTLI